MNSERVAGIVGTIVAAAVLVIAFVYGPTGRPPRPVQKVEPAAQPATSPPPVARGPVVREVPQ